MALDCPLPDIEYLSIIDNLPLPVSFDVCKSCAAVVSSEPRLLRRLLSRLRTSIARQPGHNLA